MLQRFSQIRPLQRCDSLMRFGTLRLNGNNKIVAAENLLKIHSLFNLVLLTSNSSNFLL